MAINVVNVKPHGKRSGPSAKLTFYKVGDGFLLGHHRADGEAVLLSEPQAKYALLQGIISRSRPVAPPVIKITVDAVDAEAIAAAVTLSAVRGFGNGKSKPDRS